MNYRQLALLVSLAISLHGTCYATTVAGQADNEGAQNSVTLLHDSDGQTGQIVVSNSSGISVLTAPSQQINSISAFQPPPAPIIVSPSTIQSQYGDPLANLPTPAPPPSPQQSVPTAPTQFAPPTPVSPGSTNSPTKTGQGQTSLVSNNSGTVTAGLNTSQVLTGLTLGINAISPTSSTPTQPEGFSPLTAFASPPPPVVQSPAAQPLPPATVSPLSIENHLTDQILSAVTTQASQTPAAAAQYFFDQGKDAVLSADAIGESQYLVWGPWGTPLQQAPFTQSYGIIYSSDQLTTPSTLASLHQQEVIANYQGSLQGTVAYGSTTTGISVNGLTMAVNFGSQTLTFSGANGSLSGNGSFTASAPTVTGSLSYNGTLNNNAPAALSGSFHGAFLGSAAEELGAAWAMTGKVNGTNATGAGIMAVSQPS